VRGDRVLQFRACKYGLNASYNSWADARFVEGFLLGSKQTKALMLTEFAAVCQSAVVAWRPVVDVLKDIADRIDPRGIVPLSRRHGDGG